MAFDLENIAIGEYHLTSSKNNYIPVVNDLYIEEASISMNIEEFNVELSSGQETLTISAPSSVISFICLIVALTSVVRVLVID